MRRAPVYSCAGAPCGSTPGPDEHTSSAAAGTDGIRTILLVQQRAVERLVPTIPIMPVCQQDSARCFEEVVHFANWHKGTVWASRGLNQPRLGVAENGHQESVL